MVISAPCALYHSAFQSFALGAPLSFGFGVLFCPHDHTRARRAPLCSLHALPGFGQPFGQRGGPGRHGSASAGQSAFYSSFTPPKFTTPPILTATLRTRHLGKLRFHGRSCFAPPRWPKQTRCWPHAFWQSCTTPGRLGVLSNNANPIAANGAPRRHARF